MTWSVLLSFWLVDSIDADIFEQLKRVFKITANWITVAAVPLKDVQIGIFTTKTKSPTNFTLKIVLDPAQFCLRSFYTAVNKLTPSPQKLVPSKLANVLEAMISQLEKHAESLLSTSKQSPLIEVIKEIYIFSSEVQSGPTLLRALWKATEKNINIKFRVLIRDQGLDLNTSVMIESTESMYHEFEKNISEMENVSTSVVLADEVDMVFMMKTWFRTILLHPEVGFILTIPSHKEKESSAEVQIVCTAAPCNYEVNLSMEKGLACPCHQKLVIPSRSLQLNCSVNGAVLKKEDCCPDNSSIQIGISQTLLRMNSFSSSHKELLESSDALPQLQIFHRIDRHRVSVHRLPGSSFIISCSMLEDGQYSDPRLFLALCQQSVENNECFVGLGNIDFTSNVFSSIPLYYYILLPAQDGTYFIARKLACEEQIFSDCFPPSLQQQIHPSNEVLEKAAEIVRTIPKQQQSSEFLPRSLGIHDFVEKLVSESLPRKHMNKATTKADLNKRQRL